MNISANTHTRVRVIRSAGKNLAYITILLILFVLLYLYSFSSYHLLDYQLHPSTVSSKEKFSENDPRLSIEIVSSKFFRTVSGMKLAIIRGKIKNVTKQMLDKVYVRYQGSALSLHGEKNIGEENINDTFLFPIGVIFDEDQLYQLENYSRIESLYHENASHTLGSETATSFMIILHDTGSGYLLGNYSVISVIKDE